MNLLGEKLPAGLRVMFAVTHRLPSRPIDVQIEGLISKAAGGKRTRAGISKLDPNYTSGTKTISPYTL